ncbi:MAG: PulJ/GspJ family protein [Phycisphaerales bacterium]
MSRSRSARSGFTLLEVVLATALGAMVIMVCLALLRSMERLERPLAIRQQELSDLHRARTVIQRAMSTLVMSDTSPPVNPNARKPTERLIDDGTGGKSAFETTAEATATKTQQAARPPARLLLEPDQSDELKAMLQQVGVASGDAGSIQRMEVVVDTPPIAPTFRAELGDVVAATYAQNKTSSGTPSMSETSGSGGSMTGLSNSASLSSANSSSSSFSTSQSSSFSSSRGATSGAGATNAVQSGAARGNRRSLSLPGGSQSNAKSGSLRGAFELRPMLTDANLEAHRDGKPILYELWWTPLPAAKDTSATNKLSANSTVAAATTQPADDPRTLQAWGEPVLLADNLVKCHWQFFSTGEKRSAHSAVWDKELPAYVEFEIQTRTGLYENWMFEIGWSKGPELATTADASATGGVDVGVPTGGAQGPNGANGGPGGFGPPRQGGPRNPHNNQPPQTHPGGGGPRYDNIPSQVPK